MRFTITEPLEELGSDLTAQARAGRIDPVIGREAEIARVIRILARKTKNNPVLLGEPGVGKTAVVEGLAQRIVAGTVPSDLADMTVFSLSLGSLLAGTNFRGDFEQRLQDLVACLRRPGTRMLLFIDEIHLLAKAGRSEGGLDAGNLLKPLLARGELPCIGASTTAEWRGLVSLDPALGRRFQGVVVAEPSAAQTLEMLRGLRGRYERHHRVEITEAALEAAVAESAQLPGRRFPDKALDLLDEACALLRLAEAPASASSPERAEAERELAVAESQFDLANVARLRFRVLPALQQESRPQLDAAGIARVVASLSK